MRAEAARTAWMLASAIVLGWFAATGPQLYDGGELVAAASELGGSHAPGQPLHAVIGYAATLVPFGTIAWRVALLSVGCAVLAGFFGAKIVEHLIRDLPRTWVTDLAPEAAGLGIVLAPSLLRQANRAEVYALALVLTLAALYALLRLERRPLAAVATASFVGGLAAAVHPPHAMVVFAFTIAFAAIERRALVRTASAFPLFAIGGGATYGYLPLRAAAGAPMWGSPETWTGFYDYVTASAYRKNLGAAAKDTGDVVLEAARTFGDALGYITLVPIALWLAFGLRDRRDVLLGAAAIAGLLPGLVTPLSRANPDTVAYAGPFVSIAIAIAAIGVARASVRFVSTKIAGTLAALALLGAVALHVTSADAIVERLRTDNFALDAYASSALEAPPPRALVAIESDFLGASWMMERAVADARPDVAFLVTGLSTSSWHWRSLAGHPCFDGSPSAGEGADAHERYSRGALALALGQVPIAAEPDGLVQRNGAVSGPYLVLPAGGVPTVGPVDDAGLGELFAPAIETAITRAPRGDADGAINVVRSAQLTRAERLFVRERLEAARRALLAALVDRPDVRRAIGERFTARVHPLAPFVVDRAPLGRTAGDAARYAAVFLFAAGEPRRALALLASLLRAGDHRAALEMGWLHLVGGRPDLARESIATFRSRSPELAGEESELEAALR
jgi:hypothetical protein